MGDGHIEQDLLILEKNMVTMLVKKKKKKKPDLALIKHRKALAKTAFRECAECPGTAGKLEEDGRMKCSRAGAVSEPVTAEQAQQCDGTKPPLHEVKKHHKPHPMFLHYGNHSK
jgi:hypothetical protein